jgi:hypothetical protein
VRVRPRKIVTTRKLPLDVLSQVQTCCMTELTDVLEEIGLGQYLETFIEHGFDTWDTFADITEPDLYVDHHAKHTPCSHC